MGATVASTADAQGWPWQQLWSLCLQRMPAWVCLSNKGSEAVGISFCNVRPAPEAEAGSCAPRTITQAYAHACRCDCGHASKGVHTHTHAHTQTHLHTHVHTALTARFVMHCVQLQEEGYRHLSQAPWRAADDEALLVLQQRMRGDCCVWARVQAGMLQAFDSPCGLWIPGCNRQRCVGQ